MKEQNKEWRENNKDKKQEQDRQYAKNNKDKICENQKQWHVKNRDKVIANVKEYQEHNKDIIKEKTAVKIVCECGCSIRKNDLPRHKQTSKHKQLMEQLTME